MPKNGNCCYSKSNIVINCSLQYSHSSGQSFLNATSRVLTSKITNCQLTSPPMNSWEGTRN
jgi:hypothetical protein